MSHRGAGSPARRGAGSLLALAFAVSACGSHTSPPAAGPSPATSSTSGSAHTSSHETGLTNEVSSIRQIVQSGVDAHVFPGAVVVIRRGTQTRTVAVGVANVATKTKMTGADRFQVASLTKSMVAAVTLRLVAQGRLSLSDTVEKWEPGLLPRGADITIADLLGQTSGLPDYTDKEVAHYVSGKTSTDPATMVGLVSHEPLMFPPGTRSYYSNTNFIVLGMILQTASHRTLADLLAGQLFSPLGMRSASLATSRTRTPPVADGYDHGTDATNLELNWLWAAGGVVSDVGDVARFYHDLLSGKLLPPALLHRMLQMRPETNHDLPFSGYGLGIAALQTDCGPAYGASGEVLGFTSDAWTSKNGDRAVALTFNGSITEAMNEQLVDVVLEALCGP